MPIGFVCTEAWIDAAISIDRFLSSNASYPIPTRIAVDVGAGHRHFYCTDALDGSAPHARNHNDTVNGPGRRTTVRYIDSAPKLCGVIHYGALLHD
jgi:hypothetical protein